MQAIDYAKRASQSFTLPDMCVRIRRMLDDDTVSIEHIAQQVSLDPSLSSKLLRLANSAMFRFPSQVDSLDKALSVIGGEALYNLVMAETAASAICHFSNDAVDIEGFWLNSVYTALVAKHLAKIAKVRGSERFFVLGLLHNLGELIVAQQQPGLVKKVSDLAEDMMPWDKQRHIVGFAFSECSACLLQLWKLPSSLVQPILLLHGGEHQRNRDSSLLLLAATLALKMLMRGNCHLADDTELAVLTRLNLDQQALQDAVNFARIEANQMLSLFRHD